MPITVLDYVKSVVGDKDTYTTADISYSDVLRMGGGPCEICRTDFGIGAAYPPAYPSTSGYWRCASCIGGTGFTTVADFTAHEDSIVTCPACGTTAILHEARMGCCDNCRKQGFECGHCGEFWQLAPAPPSQPPR
jgi:hypothetical protein